MMHTNPLLRIAIYWIFFQQFKVVRTLVFLNCYIAEWKYLIVSWRFS